MIYYGNSRQKYHVETEHGLFFNPKVRLFLKTYQ